MADVLSAVINDDHPLALELSSLRAAVSRYQHEAHSASLKLQRHSLETLQALDHARALERENARLKEEVAVLRANPDTTPTPAANQVPELTLALRRLSDKLTAVEETLLARTRELVDTRSELAAAQHEMEAARALTAEARAREEEGLARERVLEQKVRAVEEERRMADLVVQEYANLVRKLEGRAKGHTVSSSVSSVDIQRSANGSTATLVDSLAEGKLGLQKLLEEFNGRNELLQAEIAQLHGDNGLLYKELEVARQGAEHDRGELASALHELDKYRADDNTATKMVSRYMKFSQSATDTLQKAMTALKMRHAATLATLNAEIVQLQRALAHEREDSERVRSALDELTEDIAREAYGRRREVSLRLAFLGREENLAEHLRRWVRKAKESLERSSGSQDGSLSLNPVILREAFAKATADAEALLDTLNGQPSVEAGGGSVGSIARLALAQDTVASLTHELQEETVRRLNSERKLARIQIADHPAELNNLEQTSAVVHPVPHHIAEERRLLDVGVSASTTQMTVPHDVAADGITLPESVPIVEVVTVPSAGDVSSAVSAAGSTQSGSISTTPDEASLSVPTDSSSVSRSMGLAGKAEVKPKLEEPRSESTSMPEGGEGPPREALTLHPVTEDASTVTFPSVAGSPISDSRPTDLPTPPPAVPSPGSVQDSGPVPFTPETQTTTHVSKSHAPPPLPLEATGLALSSLSPSYPSTALPSTKSEEASLLAGLTKVKHRYDDVQRGFRDCSIALKELKKALSSLPPQPVPSPSEMSSALRKAVERLSDFNEDARVELEIRIADEERIASGYEALLSIPGAMSSPGDAGADKMDESEVVKEVRAFVDGTDRAISKAMQQFVQKLDDLEHDIASIKRTLYELPSASDLALSPLASTSSAKLGTSPNWSAWTPSFLSPPRSTSPAPTFGSVMTSPRLRHSSSFSHPRERSNVDSPTDPLAGLGLRIVVPARSPTYSPEMSTNPTGGSRASPRQRTTSGMFMLGLGMRSTSFGPSMGRQGPQQIPSRNSLASASSSRVASALSSSPTESTAVASEGPGDDGEDESDDVE
ncbi:hypothetical protein BD311DRAFT_679828 [Dichomitus squalens]|uniref:Uncharacterized protein n=1 Tax=Dichomitus squalens TaxID=114155 RepID=A0A4Q9N4G5_9APHY|nr:hypothetical protein BD311DRAFT_679828 [Dichomitus squalens]